MTSPLWRRLAAEFLGTALLVTAVVGSGIMAANLSPTDVGLQLLENSTATAFALTILILIFGPISGGHFNPAVSAADWWLGRHGNDGLSARSVGAYIGAAYWFTSSTSFANPAVTIGRAFTNTFAGIAPVSVPGFIGAQVLGLLVGIALIALLFPVKHRATDAVVRSDEAPIDDLTTSGATR